MQHRGQGHRPYECVQLEDLGPMHPGESIVDQGRDADRRKCQDPAQDLHQQGVRRACTGEQGLAIVAGDPPRGNRQHNGDEHDVQDVPVCERGEEIARDEVRDQVLDTEARRARLDLLELEQPRGEITRERESDQRPQPGGDR